MSRTDKWEHTSDSWTIGLKAERRARQPQRNRRAFEQDLRLEDETPARPRRYRTHPVRTTLKVAS